MARPAQTLLQTPPGLSRAVVNVCMQNGVELAITFPSCSPITINHSLLYSAITSMDAAERRYKRGGRRARRKQYTEETTTAAGDTSESTNELKATDIQSHAAADASMAQKQPGAHSHIDETLARLTEDHETIISSHPTATPMPTLEKQSEPTTARCQKKYAANHVENADAHALENCASTATQTVPDQQELFVQRATLYTLGTGKWEVCGTGDAKLLKCRDGQVQFMMREEGTMKTIAQHYAAEHRWWDFHHCELVAKSSKDTCCTWEAPDFADEEDPKEKAFALKFPDKENAEIFKNWFLHCTKKGLNCLSRGCET